MKKTKFKNAFKWLRNTVFQSIAVLLIVAGAVYVYAAQVTFPGTQPTPPSGLIGRFVGFSQNAQGDPITYTGSLNGYINANNTACGAYGGGAHICSMAEMLHSYAIPNDTLTGVTGQAFLNGGSPGYFAELKDCNGWRTKEASRLARFWDFDDDYGKMSNCAANIQFACCL